MTTDCTSKVDICQSEITYIYITCFAVKQEVNFNLIKRYHVVLMSLKQFCSGSVPSEDGGTCEHCPEWHYSVSETDTCYGCNLPLLLVDNDCVSWPFETVTFRTLIVKYQVASHVIALHT